MSAIIGILGLSLVRSLVVKPVLVIAKIAFASQLYAVFTAAIATDDETSSHSILDS